jgi:hypothetical protein
MDHADIVNKLTEIGRKEGFENRESVLLLRMEEMGIKIYSAKNEPFIRPKRRHINCIEWELFDIDGYVDRVVSEHLWMCRVCK